MGTGQVLALLCVFPKRGEGLDSMKGRSGQAKGRVTRRQQGKQHGEEMQQRRKWGGDTCMKDPSEFLSFREGRWLSQSCDPDHMWKEVCCDAQERDQLEVQP